MAREKTAVFDTARHTATVDDMRARREAVSARGEDVVRRTGRLDPLVEIKGKVRRSRNATVDGEGGTSLLPKGIAMPIASFFDGTGSMADNVDKAFHALGVLDAMLGGIRHRYQPQIASAVVQDVSDEDRDGSPVVQFSQFEPDERQADQLRLLVPNRNGGDPTEDYQLALAALMLATDTDIVRYDLRGYAFIVGDQIGRDMTSPVEVKTYLGHNLQGDMTTAQLCAAVLEKWHLFFIQVGSGGGARRNSVTKWWEDNLGRGRVVIVQNPNLLAEYQAALIYVTETLEPTAEGLARFISADGANTKITRGQIEEVWRSLVEAGVLFGAQAKLPGYNDIPTPGAVLAHYRHAWPIGHSKAEGQTIPVDDSKEPMAAGGTPLPAVARPIDWSRLDTTS